MYLTRVEALLQPPDCPLACQQRHHISCKDSK